MTWARPAPEPWVQDAACRGVPPATMFESAWSDMRQEPMTPEGYAAAKAICATCRVREACLGYALARREQYGIWGGMDPLERRRLLRQRAAERQRS